jgi:hypothetical protein
MKDYVAIKAENRGTGDGPNPHAVQIISCPPLAMTRLTWPHCRHLDTATILDNTLFVLWKVAG